MRQSFIRLLFFPIMLMASSHPLAMMAENRIYDPQIKTLQATVNKDWLSPPVMRLKSGDVINIGFDELSHEYHRYIYRVERCEVDWETSEHIFESDWLEGFNDNTIEDYALSMNTILPYTHYTLQIPNDRMQLKMSGNYRLWVYDDDGDGEPVLKVEFMVTEQSMFLGMDITTNTDIDTNGSHQQVSLSLGYNGMRVTRPEEQIRTVVMQNGREDNLKSDAKPDRINANGLEWRHCRQLIFNGGNEYRKYEVLDVSHPTMGIDQIIWDGEHYQVFPFMDAPRPNYLYDEDADGAFYIRNSDNRENDTATEYVWINYRLRMPRLKEGNVMIDGQWTTDDNPYTYLMEYDEEAGCYTAKVLQKQGYYSYQYLWQTDDGQLHLLPSEGNFHETENRYQALVYYKGTGERTWRLTAYGQQIIR